MWTAQARCCNWFKSMLLSRMVRNRKKMVRQLVHFLYQTIGSSQFQGFPMRFSIGDFYT